MESKSECSTPTSSNAATTEPESSIGGTILCFGFLQTNNKLLSLKVQKHAYFLTYFSFIIFHHVHRPLTTFPIMNLDGPTILHIPF